MKLEKPKLYRRLLSSMFDLALFILLSFALSRCLVLPLADAAVHMPEIRQTYNQKLVEYGLYETGDNGLLIEIELSEEEAKTRSEAMNADETVRQCLEKKTLAEWYVNIGVSCFLSCSVIYLLVPVLLKGRTFGMKLMKLCFVNALGYKATPMQIIYRGAAMYVYSILPAMIFGGLYLTLLVWCIEFIGFLCFVVLRQDMRTPQDYLAMTKVVYCDASTVLFADHAEEEAYLKRKKQEEEENGHAC